MLLRPVRVFYLELEEDGVRIALTVVDTPGFGDNINNESACVPPIPYISLTPDNFLKPGSKKS